MGKFQIRSFWNEWLANTPELGTYEDRMPEYAAVARRLRALGLTRCDRLVDVGAGYCDLDHYLRTVEGWYGRYIPVDGGISGDDLDHWEPQHLAEFYVSIETVEHLKDPLRLIREMIGAATKGIVITTPNPDAVDVIDYSLTHFSSVSPAQFESMGFDVTYETFNGTPDDTIVAVY